MSKPFKLSAVLYGHSLDVRSIKTTPDNNIISGSRDKTAKYWRANEFNAGYVETITYKDQKNFVGAVLYLEPFGDFPDGLIITGGNDNNILIYKPNEPFAAHTIQEHKDAVCCLSYAADRQKFLSSSWDKTAKLWSLTNWNLPPVTFTGHEAAVWSVIQLKNNNVITASADKTIGMWQANGQLIRKLTGHSDCVRGLSDFPENNYFISVANDAQIKVWSYTGDNINTLYGHTNYIYCICRNPANGLDAFVTGDENFSVKYWVGGQNVDTIRLPAQSVWTVACLNNGDIVTGSSDGVVRIFSQDESRHASAEALKTYEEEVNSLQKQTTQEIGGYKVSDLPGREALYDPGKSHGQIKMIRDAGAVVAYSWVEDGNDSHWEKIGDVLGANEKENEGKTLFEGKYYDYVFSVDVEDGKPPIKLPYNRGEDVYEAANKFIAKNYLPAVYLDQVVEFIQKNSQSNDPLPTGSDYVDPFTGASRYTPASTSGGFGASAGVNLDPLTGGSSYTTTNNTHSALNGAASGGNADPFTGSSSYTTTTQTKKFDYFPHHSYLKFEAGDPKVILAKMKEFNEKFGDSQHRMREATLNNLVDLCTIACNNDEVMDELYKAMDWPQEMRFPIMDVLRLAVRNEVNCNQIIKKDRKKLIEIITTTIGHTQAPNNTLLVYRTLCNMFGHSFGEEFIYSNHLDILESISSFSKSNKNIEIALASFLLNLSILYTKKNEEVGIIILAAMLPDAISTCKEPEAHFRLLVALGNLLTLEDATAASGLKAKVLENAEFITKLYEFSNQSSNDLEKKRMICAKQIQECF